MPKQGRPQERVPIKKSARYIVEDAINAFKIKYNKINLEAVAMEIGVSLSTMHRFRNPEIGASWKENEKICAALILNSEEILEDVPSIVPETTSKNNTDKYTFFLKGVICQNLKNEFSTCLEHLEIIANQSDLLINGGDKIMIISGTFNRINYVRATMILETLAELMEDNTAKKFVIKSCDKDIEVNSNIGIT